MRCDVTVFAVGQKASAPTPILGLVPPGTIRGPVEHPLLPAFLFAPEAYGSRRVEDERCCRSAKLNISLTPAENPPFGWVEAQVTKQVPKQQCGIRQVLALTKC